MQLDYFIERLGDLFLGVFGVILRLESFSMLYFVILCVSAVALIVTRLLKHKI